MKKGSITFGFGRPKADDHKEEEASSLSLISRAILDAIKENDEVALKDALRELKDCD